MYGVRISRFSGVSFILHTGNVSFFIYTQIIFFTVGKQVFFIWLTYQNNALSCDKHQIAEDAGYGGRDPEYHHKPLGNAPFTQHIAAIENA